MGTFTLHENSDVDRKIQTELDIICEEILSYVRPTTILLAGSFGKGEGSVLIQDDRIIPVTDYDLLIITEKGSFLTQKEMKNLKRRIMARCQSGEIVRHIISDCNIDLFQSTLEQLRSNANLSVYDMREGSIVLYGEDIRNKFAVDINRLAPSACCNSLFKSIKSLLNRFSIDYFISPPSEKGLFSMIFFCGKIYLHMGTQLSLCHNLYHPSSRIRGERLKEEYSRYFPDLAIVAPDLPDKIMLFSEMTLFPNNITKQTIDPVTLWFKTRQDFEIVMKYCLNTIGNLKSDDWVVLSDQMYRFLRSEYYYYFIEHYLEKRYRIRSAMITSLVNVVYQLGNAHKYIMKKNKGLKTFKLYAISPILKLFALSPLLLLSIRDDGSIDQTLFTAFQREFSTMFPDSDHVPLRADGTSWELSKNMFLQALK